jgi:hypothetical protein
MTSDHIHSELVRLRAEDRHRARRDRPPRRPTAWPDLAPTMSLLCGIAGLLLIAAPSL